MVHIQFDLIQNCVQNRDVERYSIIRNLFDLIELQIE